MIYLVYLLMCRLLAIIYLNFVTKFLRYVLNNYVFTVLCYQHYCDNNLNTIVKYFKKNLLNNPIGIIKFW